MGVFAYYVTVRQQLQELERRNRLASQSDEITNKMYFFFRIENSGRNNTSFTGVRHGTLRDSSYG